MRKIIVLLGLLLLLTVQSFAIDQFIGAVYWSDDCIKVSWDSVADADDYEVKIVWIDPENECEYYIGMTTETSITIDRPRTGHFKVMVRSHKKVDGVDYYSEVWASSDDPEYSTVDGEKMGWIVFFKVPPVGGINISKFGR